MTSLEQQMLDQALCMMLLVEPEELRIIRTNRVASQTLGYTEEALLTMSITEIESALQDVFYWEEVRGGQYSEIDNQESLYQCANGELLTVSKSVRLLEHEGAKLLLVRARDMGQERQMEEALEQTLSQLRATLESTGNGILVIDWQGRIASLNRLFSKIWDIPEGLLLARDDAAILARMAAQVEEAGSFSARLQVIVDSSETEDVFRLRDGRVLECKSRPQYLGEHIVGRVFGFTDITERTLAEIALRESRDKLEERVLERTASLEAERARQAELIKKLEEAQNQLLQSEKMASIGQLAAGVAHEINNPVGFVMSNLGSLQRYVADLLRLLAAYEEREPALPEPERLAVTVLKQEVDADYLRDDIRQLLAETQDGLERIKQIVHDLKDFSHVDSAERLWANLETGLDSTLNVVWNELKYKAQVVKEYGHIPEIECLPSQLNQVFMNLLVNAAHAIEAQGQITIRTGYDAEQVWVEVEDTGKGMTPDQIGRIFEPFYTTKPVGKGTGLGLSLSYGIVRKHGGRIEVKSEPGRGSTFRVVLPRQFQGGTSSSA